MATALSEYHIDNKAEAFPKGTTVVHGFFRGRTAFMFFT
jgi:hypothetical protein